MPQHKKTQEEKLRTRAANQKRYRDRHREKLKGQRHQYYLNHVEEIKFKEKLRRCGIYQRGPKHAEQENTIP